MKLTFNKFFVVVRQYEDYVLLEPLSDPSGAFVTDEEYARMIAEMGLHVFLMPVLINYDVTTI